MKLLVIVGSTRGNSFNARLAGLIAGIRPTDDVTVVSDLSAMPFYDGDVEASGIPPQVNELREAVVASDLVVFVTPEYNGTVPGLLMNAVDWLSRPVHQSALDGKPALVVSASPSRFGGKRAAQHLRTVLTRIGADVLARGVSVSRAHQRLAARHDPEVADELAHVLEEGMLRASSQHPSAVQHSHLRSVEKHARDSKSELVRS